MVATLKTLHSLKSSHLLVVGDLILDGYSIGKAGRISPEAPVPVVLVDREEEKAGGAGNVILNLLSLGMKVTAMGLVGDDRAGSSLVEILKGSGCSTELVAVDSQWTTPVKKRVIADNQQVVRLDYEKIEPINSDIEKKLLLSVIPLLDDLDLIAISDYGKGLCTPSFLQNLITLAGEKNIPVIVDPKGVDFSKYQGAALVKPNYKEALLASGLEGNPPLELIAEKLFEVTEIDHLVVTRSSDGISLFDREGNRSDFPVAVREVSDVTGAGDTVLALLATSLASGLAVKEAVSLANVAAGMAIEHIGCATVTLYDMACRLVEDQADHRVIGIEDFISLQKLSKNFDAVHVVIEKDQGISVDLIVEINQSWQRGDEVIVFLADENPNTAMVQALSSLRGVRMVVIGVLENSLVTQ